MKNGSVLWVRILWFFFLWIRILWKFQLYCIVRNLNIGLSWESIQSNVYILGVRCGMLHWNRWQYALRSAGFPLVLINMLFIHIFSIRYMIFDFNLFSKSGSRFVYITCFFISLGLSFVLKENEGEWICYRSLFVGKCRLSYQMTLCLLIYTLNILYKAFIQPIFDYCGVTWYGRFLCDVDKLDKIHKRCARALLGVNQLISSDFLFNMLGWEILSDRNMYFKSLMMYQTLNGLTPSYIDSQLINHRLSDALLK